MEFLKRVKKLYNSLLGMESLNEPLPEAPTPKGAGYKKETRFQRSLNRYIWQRARWDGMVMKQPVLSQSRLAKISKSCAAENLTVLCQGRKLSEDAKLI